ncbi:MAG: hypothetical protein IKM42_05230 [Clostridia bacterium]|nr:hypothetical protein [Clostridia bacterium]
MKSKLLSLLLCLSLLASFVVLFSSCQKDTIYFARNYTVVHGFDMSDAACDDVQAFAAALKKKSDKDIEVKSVKRDSELVGEKKYEILVGNTNRPETQEVLNRIKGHGYAISAVGHKIVIVGTTNLLTSLALDRFSEAYLMGQDTVSKLRVEEILVEEMIMLELTEEWSFIYSSYLRGEGDYVNEGIEQAKKDIASICDISRADMAMLKDSKTASHEILAGTVNREESKAILSGMDSTDYAVGMKNGKLVICAFNDPMMAKAFSLFKNVLKDSVCKSEEGKKQILFPAEFTCIYTDTGKNSYITDFPRPQGLALSGTIDVDSRSYQYYYEGAGVNLAAYEAYCKDLLGAGYTLYTEHAAAGSVFRTYVNKTANIMLYAAYNAFQSATVENTAHKPAIRIIVGDLEKSGLLSEEMLSMESFTKRQASAITAVKANYAFSGKGEMYIVTLEDGSFIVIDGCSSDTVISNRIYAILLDLYKRGHNGNGPTEQDPIRIAAWYVTHSHGDHYGAMVDFINTYCFNYSNTPVTIDTMIANFPSDEGYYNVYLDKSANTFVRDNIASFSAKMYDKAPGHEPGLTYIKVHTGQRFWLANVECEVLYTHDDLYPKHLHVYNDSSTVIRMTLHHTENGNITEGSKTSVIWLGDAQTASCAFMRAMYGSYLQSDMVQVAHHTGGGSEFRLYELIAPTWAWYPTDRSSYGGGLYRISTNISSLQYVVVSDFCNYTVMITKNGADPKSVINVGENSESVSLGVVSRNIDTGFLKTKFNRS